MKEPKKSNNAIPLLLIILVFGGAAVGLWWLYTSSKGSGNVNGARSGVSPTPRPTVDVSKAPLGATPPHLLGSPTSTVTVEEFADFECGACASVHPVMKEVQSIYGSKIRFIFRNFPLQMHQKAYDAAVAAEAAGLQGKYWQMQDQLFTNQTTWASPSANHKELWKSYAEKIGLNVEQWQNDIAGMAAKNRVDQDMARGRALNVGSTPTIYVNGESVPFQQANVQGLRSFIDAELQKVSGGQPAAAPAGSSNSNASR